MKALTAKPADFRLIGQKIRSRRESLHVQVKTAAAFAGISRSTLHRIEQGTPSVALQSYRVVLQTLGLDDQTLPRALPPSQATATRRHSKRRYLSESKSWLSKRIPLSRYPGLLSLAWQLDPEAFITTEEALNLYERNWRHLDLATLDRRERAFIKRLQKKHGQRNIPI